MLRNVVFGVYMVCWAGPNPGCDEVHSRFMDEIQAEVARDLEACGKAMNQGGRAVYSYCAYEPDGPNYRYEFVSRLGTFSKRNLNRIIP